MCSEKLDVEDHYVAWRQTHDQPQHQFGLDGPFSFCSYPFLLNPRAKSKLLHTEARFLMTQVPPCHLHITAWLYGSCMFGPISFVLSYGLCFVMVLALVCFLLSCSFVDTSVDECIQTEACALALVKGMCCSGLDHTPSVSCVQR